MLWIVKLRCHVMTSDPKTFPFRSLYHSNEYPQKILKIVLHIFLVILGVVYDGQRESMTGESDTQTY